MSDLEDSKVKAIDEALSCWRQGDVSATGEFEFLYLADLSNPISSASENLAKHIGAKPQNLGIKPVLDEVEGFVILTQTCDIVRSCLDRPYIEVAPLVRQTPRFVEEVRRLLRPAFAYIPATAESSLIADLDRVLTVEKSIVADWKRTPGCTTDQEIRDFAIALSRKRSRFAFPDEFVKLSQRLNSYLKNKYNKQSDEARHLRSLREIRVRASPSWNHDNVELTWWFIKDCDPGDCDRDWDHHVGNWLGRFDASGRFQKVYLVVCRLEDMTALDYVESYRLDFDSLSVDQS